jgi:hypothetical protein
MAMVAIVLRGYSDYIIYGLSTIATRGRCSLVSITAGLVEELLNKGRLY